MHDANTTRRTDCEPIDSWGLLETTDHDRMAGRITEHAIGTAALIRVDVPAIDGEPAFTKLFGPNAIFSVSFTTEETARGLAARLPPTPVSAWDAREALQTADRQRALGAPRDEAPIEPPCGGRVPGPADDERDDLEG